MPFALSLFILVAAIGAAVDFGRLLVNAATVQTRADSLLRAYLAIPAARRPNQLTFTRNAEESISSSMGPDATVVIGVSSTDGWIVFRSLVTVEPYFLPLVGMDRLQWLTTSEGVPASRLPRSPPRLIQ